VRLGDLDQVGRHLAAEAGCTRPTDAVAWCARARLDGIRGLMDGGTRPCSQGIGGGYAGIRTGAEVLVRDGAGAVLAAGRLQAGTLSAQGCVFELNVAGVPYADSYRISVAGAPGRAVLRPAPAAQLDRRARPPALDFGC
jgi:hypothetical protein